MATVYTSCSQADVVLQQVQQHSDVTVLNLAPGTGESSQQALLSNGPSCAPQMMISIDPFCRSPLPRLVETHLLGTDITRCRDYAHMGNTFHGDPDMS